jgi:hypothetical protein
VRNDVRIFNISQTFGLKTIFIRYNHDSFKVINKSKKHEILLRCLKTMMKKKSQNIKFVSAIHLFYDEYDKKNAKLEEIKPKMITTKN